MKKLRLSALSMLPLFAIFLLASCKDGDIVEPPATADEAVSGFFMVDENTPISAAKLEITDMEGNLLYTGITKENGNFTIEKENVPQDADKYVVTFSKEAKVIQQVKLSTLVEASKASAGKGNVFLGDEDEYNLEWTVKIVNSETKEPVQGAVFRLWTTRDSSGTMSEYVTDAEGFITLKIIESCMYPNYTISKEGYLKYQTTWGLRRTSTDIDHEVPTFELEPIFTPDGTTENQITVMLMRSLVRPDGAIGGISDHPLCGRKVIIKGDNGFIDSGYTGVFGDANENNYEYSAGRFTFKGLKSGLYTIRHEAVVGEYETVERTVQLAGNEKDEISLVHAENPNRCKNNVLIVKFKDKNGNPITKGTAEAKAIGVTHHWGSNVAINENGTAVFNNVEQSEEIFWLSVSTANKVYKKATTKPIIFKCGETVTIEQTLVVDRECDETACNHEMNIGINEHSTDPNWPYPIMENIGGVKIVITGPNGFIHSEVTDRKNAGRIFLENLCSGVYTATLESDEYEPASAQFSINCWGAWVWLDRASQEAWKAYKKK